MIAYLDCPMGIAGDMAVGALLDLGFPIEEIAPRVRALGIEGLEVSAEKATRAGIGGMRYRVQAPPEREHRGLAEIRAILGRADLPPKAHALALDVFERLAKAEAKIHGIPVESVHFHEVGAADALADVVGFALAWTGLGIGAAWVSPLPWTKGLVEAAHGSMPVPAPATVELLRGFAWEPSPVEGELVTPTGAAIVAAVAKPGEPPAFTLEKAGFGAGTRDVPGRPNLARVVLAKTGAGIGAESGRAVLVEANLDDMSPELVGALVERLRGAALDVWTTPVQMKKGRPGVVVSALAEEGRVDAVASILFRESTTIGLRTSRVERRILDRELVTVETEYGSIRVKIARLAGEVVNAAPEFEDVRAAAEKAGVPVKTVMAAAQRSTP